MSAPSLASDPRYPRVKDYVIEATGLAYYRDRDEDFRKRLEGRMTELRLNELGRYWDLLQDGAHGDAELDELAAGLTVGETYFFRHAEQFDALREVILPELIERNRGRRRLRIWSAGCATGAEAYSISIILRNEFAHELAGWQVSILGTDINRRLLSEAREGLFREWAFRSTPETVRETCFEREAQGWRIAPRFREGVSFQYHNLVQHPLPSIINNLAALDLIFCRNVMIYFDAAAVLTLTRRLRDCLVEDGWLVTGHAEQNPAAFEGWESFRLPGTTLYRKRCRAQEQKSLAREAFEWRPPFETSGGAAPAAASEGAGAAPAEEREAAAPAKAPQELPPQPGGFQELRAMVDRGEWRTAASLCTRLLDQEPLAALPHFYRALALEQGGCFREAEGSLRRAIYLDRGFVLAHYYLGLLLQNSGNEPARAARCFENVVELLRGRPAGEAFEHADGMTAGELKELAQMHLEVLAR